MATEWLEQIVDDTCVQQRVAAFLDAKCRPALRRLKVDAHGGCVTLEGLVPSFHDRQVALACARRV